MANTLYNALASWVTGFEVKDLTSGFRAVRAAKFREFLHLLPNGFSYPTTITMAFFRSAYSVSYAPLVVHKRVGKSHIRPIRDGFRFSSHYLQDRHAIFAAKAIRSYCAVFLPVQVWRTIFIRSLRCTGSPT